ncbi:MAG: DUF1801 domain-containing protein [Spirosomataceae bacterium]
MSIKKIPKPTEEEVVDAFVNTLRSNPLFSETQQVREIILQASDKIAERIKWNSLSYYTSADMLTFNHRKDKILLVFHHPAIVGIQSELLSGDYKDRRLVYFENKVEIEAKKNELTRIIRELVAEIDNR